MEKNIIIGKVEQEIELGIWKNWDMNKNITMGRDDSINDTSLSITTKKLNKTDNLMGLKWLTCFKPN